MRQRKKRNCHFIAVQSSVEKIVTRMGGNKTHAANRIGVSWLTVHKWLQGHPARPMYAEAVERVLKALDSSSKAA